MFDTDDVFWMILDQPNSLAWKDWVASHSSYPVCTDLAITYQFEVKKGAVISTDLNLALSNSPSGNSLVWDKLNSVPSPFDPNIFTMTSTNQAILINIYVVTVSALLINS